MPTNTQPRKRRKDARPSELTAAALGLFVEKGFSATRLEEVAQRAGVSKGTLYLYFDSKEALFKAVIQEGIIPVVDESEAMAARHVGSSFELMEKLLENWWTHVGDTAFAGIPKLMVAEARNFPEVAQFYYDNVLRRGQLLIAAALERGIASGEFRPMKVDSAIAVIIAPVLMLLIWRFSLASCEQQPTNPRDYLATYLDLLRQGLQRVRL